MLRILCSIYWLFQTGYSSAAIAQVNEDYQLQVSYSYGSSQLLPSLITNSNIAFDGSNQFSDIWFRGGFKISEQLSYMGALEITDQPHELILTKYSRPDYPLSTGRIQQSVVSYTTNKLEVKIGRDDMLSNDLRPGIFTYPLFADGMSWNYSWHNWSFKHVFQILPGESHLNQNFRRSVSYHHLSRSFNNLTIGAGEYFILTSENIGFDLKRYNPFLPYFVNSFDSEADIYPGFSGDSDNGLIKLFLDWRNQSSKVSINLYIDEFQIDAADREVVSDAILLSFSAEHEIKAFGQRNLLNWGISAANPNFGQHPGPFTTTTIGMYPLLEYTPGMKNLVYFESRTLLNETWEILIAGHSERWVNISQLAPSLMNRRDELKALSGNSDSRLALGLGYKLKNYPVDLGIEGWSGSDSGVRIKIQFASNRGAKQ
ncbi:MAG: hypothetical protein HOB84_03225 [Candidatus Marinimicrobia bacterium]|jgi:hypothetical protein|nr:hypothetical protein [Candidatus Neomarinimicrobiota bacterium]MBT6011059.1 hypothetical protein [Candidatus Neomarinimicrobiota bacterium]